MLITSYDIDLRAIISFSSVDKNPDSRLLLLLRRLLGVHGLGVVDGQEEGLQKLHRALLVEIRRVMGPKIDGGQVWQVLKF